MLFDLKQDQVGESGANCVTNERANKLSQLRVYSMNQHNEKRMAAMSSFTLTKQNEIRTDMTKGTLDHTRVCSQALCRPARILRED